MKNHLLELIETNVSDKILQTELFKLMEGEVNYFQLQ